ncbi:hypothetical protein Goari_024871, partial [Gossypium aridum]|nr:hypothetical protein [Gossypium aridum]
MEEDLNALLARLIFSEAESKQAVGTLITKEKINKEAMYRVLKSLWFTKESPRGYLISACCYVVICKRSKFDKVGEVVVIDWRDREGCWIEGSGLRLMFLNLYDVLFIWLGGMESRLYVSLSMGGSRFFAIVVGISERGNWRNDIEFVEKDKESNKPVEKSESTTQM